MEAAGKSLLVAVAGFLFGATVVVGVALIAPPITPVADAPIATPEKSAATPTSSGAAPGSGAVGDTQRRAMDALVTALQEPEEKVEREAVRPIAAAPARAAGPSAPAPGPIKAAASASAKNAPAATKSADAAPVRQAPPARRDTQNGNGDLPAWQRYAVATDLMTDRPMLAIILDDMGLNRARMERAIALPAPLTLAILPYGYELPELAAKARAAGHELLVHMPTEPSAHGMDPGPNALLTGLDSAELRRRIGWNLSRFSGYVGVNNHMGSRFTEKLAPMQELMREIHHRGLLFVDSVTTSASVGGRLAQRLGVPTAGRDVFIDNDRTPAKIREQLSKAVAQAHRRGQSIAIGHPYPETLRILKQWLPRATGAGVTLVPVSGIIRRRLAG